jgi:hypothetical protein
MFYLNDEQSSNNFTCSNLLDNMSSWNGKLFVILFHNYNYAIKYALLFKNLENLLFFHEDIEYYFLYFLFIN